MSNSEGQGIYLNGKKQIIEMLQFMDNAEKSKLLGNIKARNAVMARELSEQSFSFNDLESLTRASLTKVLRGFDPVIIGLAIAPLKTTFQRKILQSLSREVAEESFQVMNSNLRSRLNECKKAQQKIISVALQLSRRQQINL